MTSTVLECVVTAAENTPVWVMGIIGGIAAASAFVAAMGIINFALPHRLHGEADE